MPDECLSPSLLAFSGDVRLQIFNAKFQHGSLVWGAHGSNQLLPWGWGKEEFHVTGTLLPLYVTPVAWLRGWSAVPMDRTGGTGHELEHGRFPLNTRQYFFTAGVTKHQNMLPRDDVETPLLETFKSCLDIIMCPCLSRGWIRWPPEVHVNLDQSVILWFQLQEQLTRSLTGHCAFILPHHEAQSRRWRIRTWSWGENIPMVWPFSILSPPWPCRSSAPSPPPFLQKDRSLHLSFCSPALSRARPRDLKCLLSGHIYTPMTNPKKCQEWWLLACITYMAFRSLSSGISGWYKGPIWKLPALTSAFWVAHDSKQMSLTFKGKRHPANSPRGKRTCWRFSHFSGKVASVREVKRKHTREKAGAACGSPLSEVGTNTRSQMPKISHDAGTGKETRKLN